MSPAHCPLHCTGPETVIKPQQSGLPKVRGLGRFWASQAQVTNNRLNVTKLICPSSITKYGVQSLSSQVRSTGSAGDYAPAHDITSLLLLCDRVPNMRARVFLSGVPQT